MDPQPSKIRVLVVAGVRLYCEGLAEALSRRSRIDVVGVAGDAAEGLRRNHDLQPDVVLVDTSMPEAVAMVSATLTATPRAKVIALAVSEDDPDVLAFAEAGVFGYVPRDAALDDLVATIESVSRGEARCSPQLTATLLRHIGELAGRHPAAAAEPRLTHREFEVIELIDLGLSNKEIARRLCIEVPTVKNHVHRILEKLDLDRRDEAAAWARAHEGYRLVRLRANRSRI